MEDKKDQPEPEAGARANLMEEDKSDNDDTWDEADDELEALITCLFCPRNFKTMAVALEHCKVEHRFSLLEMKIKFDMDCYSYIRMINFIRKEGITPEALYDLSDTPWHNESYLAPVIEDDPWLMFDFEGLEIPILFDVNDPHGPNIERIMTGIKHDNDLVTLSEGSFSFLQKSLQFYADEVQKKDSMLAAATQQITEMQAIANKLFSGDVVREISELENKMLSLRIIDDSGYFKTYSHYGIHLEMLSDEVRMLAYREAILQNAPLFANKVVLDVGCGSGILSLFSARAGAKKVYGVDNSEIIYRATEIVNENDMSSKIELIHGKMEEVELPVEKVDIIVSEWIGYFLLFEGMLDSVLYARNKYLKPSGQILPDRCNLYIIGLADPESYRKMIKFWNNVYGFKMSCLAKEVLQEAAIFDVSSETICTSAAHILDLNLYFQDMRNTNFASRFTLEAGINGEMTAICGYFSVTFNLPHEVNFSTTPTGTKTHWKQTVFFLSEPIKVKKGTLLKGYIDCRKKEEDKRSLIVTIYIGDQKNVYLLG